MERNRSSAKTYIILFIILCVAIMGIFLMLNMAKKARKAAPLRDDSTTEKTSKKSEAIVTTNFSSSLLDIIGSNRFLYNYKEEVNFSGAVFNFNCTSYNEEEKVCEEGSGLMNTGSALIPLFTYKNENENYLKRAEDYYIIVNDDFIVLVMNEAGVKKGVAKVMSRQGEYKYDIENVITGYKDGKEVYRGLYPSMKDNKITYYACESKNIKILSLDLNKPEEIEYLEDIEKVSCN